VDFAWPELGVFLEFDGKVKYESLLKDGERASDVVIREKRREEMICGLTGWRCIRITWADLFNPARTATRIKAVLAGRPWAA
jgi:very-short-patch-repair endonuclease